MKKTTARKATQSLHKGKKLENQTALKSAQPVQYLQVKMDEVYISSVSI